MLKSPRSRATELVVAGARHGAGCEILEGLSRETRFSPGSARPREHRRCAIASRECLAAVLSSRGPLDRFPPFRYHRDCELCQLS